MDLYSAVLASIAKKYTEQTEKDTEIILEKNDGNSGGNCSERTFTAGVLYKIILPVPLISPENYVLVLSSGDGGNYKAFNEAEKSKVLTEYEHNTTSFFLLFKQTLTCRFFTNRIPHN